MPASAKHRVRGMAEAPSAEPACAGPPLCGISFSPVPGKYCLVETLKEGLGG